MIKEIGLLCRAPNSWLLDGGLGVINWIVDRLSCEPDMLSYLLARPELSFTPPETADLCEAFDLAIAELQEKHNTSANWAADDVRAMLSAAIVEAWQRGERNCRRLSDQAVRVAHTQFGGDTI